MWCSATRHAQCPYVASLSDQMRCAHHLKAFEDSENPPITDPLDALGQMLELLPELCPLGLHATTRLHNNSWPQRLIPPAAHALTYKPPATAVPKCCDLFLGDVRTVYVLLCPTRDEHLVLDTKGIRRSPITVLWLLSKRREIQRGSSTLHGRRCGIVGARRDCPAVLAEEPAGAAWGRSTSTEPRHCRRLQRLT